MKLKNTSGGELTFPSLGFTAPAGDFDVTKSIGDKLIKNDSIILAEEIKEEKKATKVKKITYDNE